MNSQIEFSLEEIQNLLLNKNLIEFFHQTGKEKFTWEEVKEYCLPHVEALHWHPPVKKRLSHELIKENERIKEFLVNYVFY